MTEYIVKSDDSEWYVYLSQIDGMSLTGCAEIAHKFQTIDDAENMAKELNNNPLFKKYQMRVESVVPVGDRRKHGFEIKKDFYAKQAQLFEGMKMQVSIEDSDKIKADDTKMQLELF